MTTESPKRRSGGMHDCYVETHPAYGSIQLTQVSGGTHLAGSDFRHPYFFKLEITQSQIHRGLSRDRWRSGDRIVSVYLSPAQFTAMIGSIGKGDGTPCTLQWVRGQGSIPDIEPLQHQTDTFKDEMGEKLSSAIEAMQHAVNVLESANNAKTRKESANTIKAAMRTLQNSAPFVAQQFGEHIEETVEAAKAEAHAILSATIQRAGLDALQTSAREKDMKLIEAGDES